MPAGEISPRLHGREWAECSGKGCGAYPLLALVTPFSVRKQQSSLALWRTNKLHK